MKGGMKDAMLVKFLAVLYVGIPIPLATVYSPSRCDPRGFWGFLS